jgi:hypothetical protein
MNTNKLFSLSALLSFSLWFGSFVYGQVPVHETLGMRVPAATKTAEQQALAPRAAAAFQPGRNVHELGEATGELEAVQQKAKSSASRPGPPQVGVVRAVAQKFGPGSFIKTELPAETSAATPQSVWTLALRSPEALGLRLHFVNFDVGSGSVIVYGRRGDGTTTLGPFIGQGPQQKGDFWTALLPGDTAFIEVTGGAEPRLEISEVMHFDQDPLTGCKGLSLKQPGVVRERSCHLDVMSENVDPFARDATARLNYQVGGVAKVCTGTLLQDLDGDTVMPYLLTAKHCEITNANVSTLMATFLFQTGSTSQPTLTGGVVLESHEDNDMTFIRLNGAVPAGVTVAGWSTGDPSDGSYGIHHPGGTFKRVTFFNPSSYVLCPYTYDGDYWVMEARRGGIEKGSSGSGLFNPSGRLIGQLKGRCGPGTDEDNGNCSDEDGWRAVYGKFSVTHGIIRRWLEIGGTINVNRSHGGNELGTPAEPYRTVTGGYNLAWDNTRLKIRAGSYNEAVTFSKPMTILADGGPVTIGR